MDKYIPEFVYGGVDGTITTFAIVSGTIGADLPLKTIIILGLANVIADGFSMAASSYLSAKAEKEMGIISNKTPFQIGLATFISFVLIGLIPISVFIYFMKAEPDRKMDHQLYLYSFLMTGIALFFVGYMKGRVLGKNRMYTGLQTTALGLFAGMISYQIGKLVSKKT